MKKLLFSILAICPLVLLAQSNIQFNVGPEIAYPIGSTNKVAEIGAGATIKAVVNIFKDVKWTFTTGYITMKGKDIVITDSPKVVKENPDLSFIPVKMGVRITLMKDFFFEPEAVIRVGTNYASKAGFGFAGGFGYYFKIKKTTLDISARYENTYYKGAPLSFLGGRIGISFPN